MKKLKQAEEKEKSNERETQKSMFQEAFIITNASIDFQSSLLRVISTPYAYNEQYGTLSAVFQPPRA